MDFLAQLVTAPLGFVWHYVLPFVGILGVLLFVHEWGHYIVARLCGVKVDTFSIGFGRELWTRTDRSGTKWRVNLFPVGGFVVVFGHIAPEDMPPTVTADEDGNVVEEPHKPFTEEEKKVAFYTKPVWQRMLIAFAGPAVNFLFAVLLLFCTYTFHGEYYTLPVMQQIVEGMPADEAGLQTDDLVVSVNGEKIERYNQLILNYTKPGIGVPLEFEVAPYLGDGKWSDETRKVTVTPMNHMIVDRFGFTHSEGRIGIFYPKQAAALQEHTVGSAAVQSFRAAWGVSKNMLDVIGQIVLGTRDAEEVGGVLRIGSYAGQVVEAGFMSVIMFMVTLSLSLCILNLIPLPVLDGGHMLIFAIEGIKGSPVSYEARNYALRLSVGLILAFFIFVTWNDLVHLNVIDYLVKLAS